MNRRHFLRGVAVAAGATASLPLLAVAPQCSKAYKGHDVNVLPSGAILWRPSVFDTTLQLQNCIVRSA